ncbi:hypothetical protein FGG08_006247 [Glutinoglossum americanum]|uniref:Transcription initiation factor TFIID subunit 1 histone acetyltransferase domain-containing protein n=1 Tax=Glutinoglossum americanum TaxID=1670608 RepID=A0A9P8I5M6_9PEZI|nr:hypothetical protein FGG08_006247 [Glutinoglossum americanum]
MASVAPARASSHHLHLPSVITPQRVEESLSPQDEEDTRQITQLINGDNVGSLDFLNRPLEPGEKADDAIDYEDISDDDLAEDIDMRSGGGEESGVWDVGGSDGGGNDLDAMMKEGNLPHGEDSAVANGNDFDDLFGDFGDDVNGKDLGTADGVGMSFDFDEDDQLPNSSATLPDSVEGKEAASSGTTLFRDINFGQYIPPPPANNEELLASIWPGFDRDAPPKFMSLLPPKKAYFVGKVPLRPPRPVHPTKVSLELEQDQEKLFRMSNTTTYRQRTAREEAELKGLVLIENMEDISEESSDDEDVFIETEYEPIGGVSWRDIEIACADWDSMLQDEPSDPEPEEAPAAAEKRLREDDLFGEGDDDWDREFGVPPAKKQKAIAPINANAYAPILYAIPSFDDPERATARIAKSVVLDLNDPKLLVDIHQSTNSSKRARQYGGILKRRLSGSRTKDLSKRYNISNDVAYEQLKENQSKVRSIIGNLTVEHSMPALRLQYPYYKTKLGVREARSFHRPILSFRPNEMVRFSSLGHAKRKHTRGKSPKSLFASTKDLSLADNSHALLLEYSEEHPIMLSNFGMHNRIINYYRRKNIEDTARPKLDLGETALLLPQDKSPFSIFGTVEPGQVVPALHNAMFRAPIFKQQAKPNDFLVVRNTTGVGGSSWHIRNVENLYVVGQELPSVDVPGPHSRKVTTATKNRLRMITYRKIRKNKPHRINVSEITAHFPETTDMQNRQKMKEFMQFSKEYREWEMRDGEAIPDEETVQAMIEPEDVCLLESMQVGVRHLADAGYAGTENEDEEEKEGQTVHQQLAPWNTTKNFLLATQGKAMLQLHGEGDPSGRGCAFSFIKTSMKGGFKPIGESVEDRLDSKRKNEQGQHPYYNVAKQQKAYEESIAKIWGAQNTSLSTTVEPSDAEVDDAHRDDTGDLFEDRGITRSEAAAPAAFGHHGDDETTSQFSRISASSQRGKVLRITRDVRNRDGIVERQSEVIRDPRVIRQYLRRRRDIEAERVQVLDLPNRPTGDTEQDRQHMKRIEEELARLSRNKDRRVAREKQKGLLADGAAMSPDSPGSPSASNMKVIGTTRKCANCGRVGHIKTNKKY